nr:MAG TPA: hypothetical protein [Bacteriophage sp.]
MDDFVIHNKKSFHNWQYCFISPSMLLYKIARLE